MPRSFKVFPPKKDSPRAEYGHTHPETRKNEPTRVPVSLCEESAVGLSEAPSTPSRCADAACPEDSVCPTGGEETQRDEDSRKGGTPMAEGKAVEVYGDVDVCRALRIRRRIIAAARTKKSRGADWDIVGLHAGMTRGWIMRKADALGIGVDLARISPIREGDHVVSCVLAATVPNNRRAICEIAATGERKVAWVADSTMMRLGDIFDCIDDHGVLSARQDLNAVVY